MPPITTQPGSRFYATDFHLHTPASHDYREKAITAKDWVNAAIAKGLDIVGITDHNSAEWVDQIRDAAKGAKLIVFPGVEVSTPHCHILVLFDPTTKKSIIDDFLVTVGIKTADRGKKEAHSKSIEDVLDAVEKFGGLAIAAHANSSNGFMQQGSGQYRLGIYNGGKLAGLEFTKKDDVEKFIAGKVDQYGPKACFQGSDAHTLAEIGTRRCFLRMDKPSIWALLQTTRDHTVRIRHEWNHSEPVNPAILELRTNQGFFENTAFAFHGGLNCLVGGRGTGKSTAIELLRFAFGDESSIDDIAYESESKINALLGLGGSVTVKYLDGDGRVKIVQRKVGDARRTVKTEQGSSAEVVLPPAFFSQGELTRIAQDRTAQLDLIDRYVDTDEDTEREDALVGELHSNAVEIDRLETQTQTSQGELDDKDKGLKASRQKYDDLSKTLSDPVLKEYPAWESEGRYLRTAEEALAELEEQYEAALDDIDPINSIADPDDEFPNLTTMKAVPKLFEAIEKNAQKHLDQLKGELSETKKELAKIKKKWDPLFKSKRETFEKALDKAGAADVRKAHTQLRELKEHLDNLERKDKARGGTSKKLAALWSERSTALDELDRVRASRYKKRSSKASAWQTAFNNKISVGISQLGDKSEYVAKIREVTKGAMLRDPDIEALAKMLTPRTLVALIRKDDAARIASTAGIKRENAQKLIDTIHSKSLHQLLDLESVDIQDVPDIKYEAEQGRTKGLGQLSTGQRATVIISLGLVEGNTPLIIDQPEEPLDTLAITTPVVDTLRAQKDKRQFIFTTHNANVAVGGDAELNIVLEAGSDKGVIKAVGSVDDPRTNELLILTCRLSSDQSLLENGLGLIS